MSITFKKVLNNEDIKLLAQTAEIVWHEAFKEILTLEQIEYMIKKFQSYEALSLAINKDNYEYFFIKDNNIVVGYTGLQKQGNKLFLSKLYILKEYRGKKIATKSFEFIENLAKEKGLKSIFLTVNRFNNHAINVYKHKGFINVKSQVSDIGNGFVMDDYVFEKEIK